MSTTPLSQIFDAKLTSGGFTRKRCVHNNGKPYDEYRDRQNYGIAVVSAKTAYDMMTGVVVTLP